MLNQQLQHISGYKVVRPCLSIIRHFYHLFDVDGFAIKPKVILAINTANVLSV